MTSLDDLRGQLRALSPVDDREAYALEATLARLDESGDPFDEERDLRHLTASAFVVSSRGIVLHRHRKLGIWVQPGGHVDPGEDPAGAARRETLEETGLAARHLDPPLLFHVDVHEGPRGHTHFDLRYVLVAPPIEPRPLEGESPEVYWFSFEDAQVRCEETLKPALVKVGEWYANQYVRDSCRE